VLTCHLSLVECLLYIECPLSSFECLLFVICDIVYLSTALECVLQELSKAIHTDVIFRVIGEY